MSSNNADMLVLNKVDSTLRRMMAVYDRLVST